MPSSPQSRYDGLAVVEVDGVPSLALRRPASADPDPAHPGVRPGADPDSLVHVIVGGETLDQIAKRYYGREDLWWRIADANPRRLPFEWRAGEELLIPPLRTAGRATAQRPAPGASTAASRRRG
jgi:nucleoid-associated protein YgaU